MLKAAAKAGCGGVLRDGYYRPLRPRQPVYLMNSISPRSSPSPQALPRRGALTAMALAGGGALFGIPHARAEARPDFGPGGPEDALKIWLRVGADNTVTVACHLAEMGQGITTALCQMVAEELGAAWSDMRFVFAPNGKYYHNRGYANKFESTGGSTSVRGQFRMFREIGAVAREMFKAAGAAAMNVPAGSLSIENTRVVHAPSGRALPLSALAAAAARQTPPADVALRASDTWTILGQPMPRLDTPAKIDGSAGFGVDVNVPGMLVATIQQCPVFTGTLKAVDPAPALRVKGVSHVVTLDNAVAVVADGYWPALTGLKALRPEWALPARAGYGAADLQADLDAQIVRADAPEMLSKGDMTGALAAAKAQAVFDYQVPYLTHACMEPMNATAHVQKDRVDVWMPGQGATTVVEAISKSLGVAPTSIHVHRQFLGGGFGRRGEADVALQAALVSSRIGRPVKLMWSREEDIRQDFYRPAAKVRFTVALDEKGLPTGWDIQNAVHSITKRRNPEFVKDNKDASTFNGFGDQPYNIANLRGRFAIVENGIPVGYWRSVHHSQNIFFREAMINELAARAGLDGLAYRRALLAGNARYLALLDAVARLSDYGVPLSAAPAGARRGRGVALGNANASLCAQVIDITVRSDNAISVDRVSCVVDVGTVVNPGIIAAQMESSIMDGLSMAMYGGVTPKAGGMAEGNFNEVRFLRLPEAPREIRVEAKGWADTAPGGVGEPGLPPVAPALIDALAQATGRRLRALPVARQGYSV